MHISLCLVAFRQPTRPRLAGPSRADMRIHHTHPDPKTEEFGMARCTTAACVTYADPQRAAERRTSGVHIRAGIGTGDRHSAGAIAHWHHGQRMPNDHSTKRPGPRFPLLVCVHQRQFQSLNQKPVVRAKRLVRRPLKACENDKAPCYLHNSTRTSRPRLEPSHQWKRRIPTGNEPLRQGPIRSIEALRQGCGRNRNAHSTGQSAPAILLDPEMV